MDIMYNMEAFYCTIYISDSDLVWRIPLMITKGKKNVLCVKGILNL